MEELSWRALDIMCTSKGMHFGTKEESNSILTAVAKGIIALDVNARRRSCNVWRVGSAWMPGLWVKLRLHVAGCDRDSASRIWQLLPAVVTEVRQTGANMATAYERYNL